MAARGVEWERKGAGGGWGQRVRWDVVREGSSRWWQAAACTVRTGGLSIRSLNDPLHTPALAPQRLSMLGSAGSGSGGDGAAAVEQSQGHSGSKQRGPSYVLDYAKHGGGAGADDPAGRGVEGGQGCTHCIQKHLTKQVILGVDTLLYSQHTKTIAMQVTWSGRRVNCAWCRTSCSGCHR